MHDRVMQERIMWAVGVAVLAIVVSLFIGGIYTITPPNGPVDTAYKINRFTGKVWLVKTYDKQVGQIRVFAAREAAVEPTKEINSDADLPSVAMQQEHPVVTRRR
jgi:hypothetical protein